MGSSAARFPVLLGFVLASAAWSAARADPSVEGEKKPRPRIPHPPVEVVSPGAPKGDNSRDKDCLVCHAGIGEEDAPKIEHEAFRDSAHKDNGCISCHADVETPGLRHEEKDQDLAPVDCGSCHKQQASGYDDSEHRKKTDGPTCDRCHGRHDIRSTKDPKSRAHILKQVSLCGECHKKNQTAAGHTLDVPKEYKGLVESAPKEEVEALISQGLLVTAVCTDCHGVHALLPAFDPKSALYFATAMETCGKCHQKQRDEYKTSVHAKVAERLLSHENGEGPVKEGPDDAPVLGPHGEVRHNPASCNKCHPVHETGTPKSERFRLGLVKECGTCHGDLMRTYEESYHGKATELGDATVAKCSDCHGSHGILPRDDPRSNVNEANKAETCRRCHKDSPDRFAKFWAHADPHDQKNYPLLYWVWLFMTTLLISVFSFFGLHTLLWAIREQIEASRKKGKPHHPGGPPIQRFELFHRVVHAFVVVSFLGLAATGAPLKFAHTPWAKVIFGIIGGVRAAGWWHRFFAIVTFGYFFVHVVYLVRKLVRYSHEKRLFKLLLGPDTMIPMPWDIKDVFAHMRYFLGLGPKPTWDRWTYWEKFDYWAVFWGVAIIGGSGLILWFPTVFSAFLPGWLVNIALVIHSDEALLAICFIFAVHFFNGHLRRSKFPMDPVIFTGTVPEDEFREERGREWARVVAEDRVAELRAQPPTARFMRTVRILGISAWAFGVALLVMIIHGLLST